MHRAFHLMGMTLNRGYRARTSNRWTLQFAIGLFLRIRKSIIIIMLLLLMFDSVIGLGVKRINYILVLL